MPKEQIILGIDPGTTIMGYGILKVTGNKTEMLAMGILDLKKYSDHYLKLQRIFARTLSLIDEFHPDYLAIEAPFFGKNVQSMLKLGRAQGVAMSAALYRDIPITEYAPLKIKMAITGSGSASKEQVADMLRRYLNIPKESMLPQLDIINSPQIIRPFSLIQIYNHFRLVIKSKSRSSRLSKFLTK
jgi:crossover junction endodeoxyribonuclease RuvC